MPPTDLLIDGYNLLHAAGLGRARYGRGDLQRARQALLRRLFQQLTPAEIARTAVVFDARHPPPHLPPHWYIHGLRVVYAQPHGDADVLLEELIQGHSAPRQLTVVSSDHRLQRAATRRRAAAIDSDEFLDFLEHRVLLQARVELPAPHKSDRQTDVTTAELAYWLSVFGDVKVADLAEPPKPNTKSGTPAPSPATDQQTSPPARSRRRSGPPVRSGVSIPAAPPAPELFSAEWIAELQRWVDQQQK